MRGLTPKSGNRKETITVNVDESKQISRFLMPEDLEQHLEQELIELPEDTDRICRLHYTSGDIENDLFIYVHMDKIIAVCQETSKSFCYDLKDCECQKGMCAFLLGGISLPEQISGESPALLMSRYEYDEIRRTSDSCSLQELRRYVELATGDYRQSARFAKSVKCRQTSGELRICSRSGRGWSFQYASFFADHSCGWLLRMSCGDEDWLSATPVGKKQFCDAFLEWLLHLNPFTSS
ncbi:hypothetical protein SAMN04487895_101337 [Paenibacillus sophorae]|uniref:Uncharacterized protein n=1 Tax=Paenibacillus sophorae TaxID=1333845 RepID=A0A1H8G384_9BACL|nr:hypothetical protein [Paenibacillus sophorae]QWU14062.1 hypothetical protein KP014_19240 [Paenibacillus sophorae]SEN37957.1 hypothetical protein SAMN04487895_101337 [Paenibacillus sophorae]